MKEKEKRNKRIYFKERQNTELKILAAIWGTSRDDLAEKAIAEFLEKFRHLIEQYLKEKATA